MKRNTIYSERMQRLKLNNKKCGSEHLFYLGGRGFAFREGRDDI